MWTFFNDLVWDFSSKRGGILEFAINKEGSSDIKSIGISLICENTPYFKKNLWRYGCRKWESPAEIGIVHMYGLE
jgi:hypothetical protein